MKKNITSYIIQVIIISLAYSIVRYNVFNNVSWTDLPLYTINKAVFFSAIIYVATYLILEKSDHHELSIKIKKYATPLIYIHLTISLLSFIVSVTPFFIKKKTEQN